MSKEVKRSEEFLALTPFQQWFHIMYMDWRSKTWRYSYDPYQLWATDDNSTKFWHLFAFILISVVVSVIVIAVATVFIVFAPLLAAFIGGLAALAGGGAWLIMKKMS